MRVERSASQILFGYLPEQTVDLNGRIWKVTHWEEPEPEHIDPQTLRRELIAQARPWTVQGRDGGYSQRLHSGWPVSVVSLNPSRGARVEPYPRVWLCRACNRLAGQGPCRCGSEARTQMPFVGYHECGTLEEPFVPTCPAHDAAQVIFPGTNNAGDIRIRCPECDQRLQQGLGLRTCQCGQGRVRFTVHRAASVYRPCSVVLVSPPSTEEVRELQQSGGAARALDWVLDGMSTPSYQQVGLTREGLIAQLVAQGLSQELAEQTAQTAWERGEIRSADGGRGGGSRTASEENQNQAVKLALATLRARLRREDLEQQAPTPELAALYAQRYPSALDEAGLEAVELVDRFPVLTGNFAYVRGSDRDPTHLVPYTDSRGNYLVYADLGDTEALLVRLDPLRVLAWLREQGHQLRSVDGPRAAREEILGHATIPALGDELDPPTVGSHLATLVHSYAHRLLRRAAVFAGIEANSLGELLLPLHLSFFVYATPRGDFVLGGLQALFESELHLLLDEVAHGEHRCSLDPGCANSGGACMACLHIGEPSCRWFNRLLDRSVLHGPRGYLARPTPPAAPEAILSPG